MAIAAENNSKHQAKIAEPAADLSTEVRRLFAELLGTFGLTFVGAGTIMVDTLSRHQLDYTARVVAPGLLVMVAIYTLGQISGAHINPAVTLAFALRGDFAWSRVPGYWAAQFIGAILAAAVLVLLLGPVADLGSTLPHLGVPAALAMEIILTCLLVMVIIGTATGHKLVGPNAGIAVGAAVALCGMVGDPVSGASMNPARSLGPALLGGRLDIAWVYVVGPVLGALLAVVFSRLLHGSPNKDEREAASGSGAKSGESEE